MFEYTRNNHLKISHYLFVKDEVEYPYSITDIGEPQLSDESALTLASHAAEQIYERNGCKAVNLFLSGGLDSECMLAAFVKAKVPFTPVAIEFKDKLNRHDFQDLQMMCKKYSIQPKIYQFDIIEFYESGRHFELAEKYVCRSPQFTAHFEFLSLVNGPSLMAWQPLKVRKVNGVFELILPHDNYFSYCRFVDANNLAASPFFFLDTPELAASFLKGQVLTKVRDGVFDGESYEFKVFQYQQGGFDVSARQSKYTGFELVKEYYKLRYPSQADPFNEIYRFPLENAYPLPYPYSRYSARYLNE